MAYQPLERLLPKAEGSIYRLVRMASKRALELSDGKRCLVEHPSSDKVTTMALEEIMHGKVESKESAGDGASKNKKQDTENKEDEEKVEVGIE